MKAWDGREHAVSRPVAVSVHRYRTLYSDGAGAVAGIWAARSAIGQSVIAVQCLDLERL